MRVATTFPGPRSLFVLLAAAGLSWISACSAGGGGGSDSGGNSASGNFLIEQITVANGEIWQINRPIDIRFSETVDFSTVNLNTINLKSFFGVSATGQFILLQDGKTVRFEPRCPTLDDYSDAGLTPFSDYRLDVRGTSGDALTVRSAAGESLEIGQTREFSTPDSSEPQVLFIDTVPGPPGVRLRGRTGVATDALTATHLVVQSVESNGEVVSRRVFFQWDLDEQLGFLEDSPFLPQGDEGEPLVPLNLYSQVDTQVSALVYLDQPVDPSSSNISNQRVVLEYESSPGSWSALTTQVELIANCTETGAILRLTPDGILPQGAGLRVNLKQGFRDLTGDRVILDLTNFARAEITTADNPIAGGADAARSADEFLEGFAVGGTAPGSLEDTTALFAEPSADWGGGQLRASFDFGGTGGPGGDFSWVIPAGTVQILDTTTDVIVGGPNGVPTTSQTIINGVVDVVDLTIESGASLLVQGPNPLTILAAGNVRIDGILSVSGSASDGVVTLGTANQAEPGASGQAGGGAGGTGSFLTNQSTPRGGSGFGAFGATGTGGQGGETGYATGSKNNRRGAGGGGGRLGPDVIFPFDLTQTPDFSQDPNMICQALVGMDAENGFDGGPLGLGAVSQTERARGGDIAPSPFFDDNPYNDFLGNKIRYFAEFVDGEPELRQELVIGELTGLWAGSGGGAGGDAVRSETFPLTPFVPTGDEKGAGGGGGAGGLMILATGDVVLGPEGEVHADGGPGGGGENSLFFDRVGGGSGGGAGGHVVISTAGEFRVEHPGTPAGGTWYNDIQQFSRDRPFTALGGQGGAGAESKGGANEDGVTFWRCDGIPFERFREVNTQELVVMPPVDISCFENLEGVQTSNDPFNWIDPDNEGNPGGGGDGSPGIIQIHVNDPLTNIVFVDNTVYGQGTDISDWFAPPPHGWNSINGIDVEGDSVTVNLPPDRMVPFFGRRSVSRSRWISLGLARVNTGDVPVEFGFSGTTAGNVDSTGDEVDLLAPLIGPLALGQDGSPEVTGDSQTTLVIDASSLTGTNSVYRRNPDLLRQMTVRVERIGDTDLYQDFQIASASYDVETDALTLDVSGASPIGISGVPTADQQVSLIRRDFLVQTNSIVDFLPSQTGIEIQFQATVAGTDGLPNEADTVVSDSVTDITDLNLGGPSFEDWDFIRFQVTFDLNADETPGADLANTPRPGLEFLRIPFGF